MNGISGSIIVLAGAVALMAGSLAEGHHSEGPNFIGVALIILGTIGYFIGMGTKKG